MAFNQVTNLDFEDIKLSLKEYLRASDTFTDYNFEGSVLSQLIDVLAFNTYYSALNANLVANEVFFDSASIRENVVSLAKLVGYTPRSARTSKATITMDMEIPPSIPTLTLKKGVAYTGSNGEGTFVFSVLDDITREAYIDSNGNRKITFTDIEIYQGNIIDINYAVDTSVKQNFVVPNENADVTTLRVVVDEINNSIPQTYRTVKDITEIGASDRVYFLQETKNEKFEVIFGDDVFGRRLKNKDVITMQYVVTNMDSANLCTNFNFIGALEYNGNLITSINPTITTTIKSVGGAQPESISSIKYLAPRYYASQKRAVTVRDYETLVAELYPNLESLSVFGGEDADPPQYGKVFIVAKPNGAEKLTTTGKQELQKEIKNYSVLSVIPEILDPSFVYLEFDSFVYFDVNRTRRTSQELNELVKKTIFAFGSSKDINRFNGKFKYSKLVAEIDDSDVGITSNITRIRLRKNLQVLSNIFVSYQVCFGNRISQNSDVISSGFKISGENTNYTFYFEKLAGTNTLAVFRFEGDQKKYYSRNIGNLDYERGEINISAINVNRTLDGTGYIKFSVIPASNDIIALRDLYLTIAEEDVKVTTIVDRLTSSSRTSGVGQVPVSS
jgi:hypothetical protein